MKTTQWNFFILLLIGMACITACTEEEELPQPNSFQFSINDEEVQIIDFEVMQKTNGFQIVAFITDSIYINLFTTGSTTGNYAAGSGALERSSIDHSVRKGFRYITYSSRLAPPDDPSKIVITSVDQNNQTITGHFSGTLYDSNGETLEISNGEFHEIPFRDLDVSQNSSIDLTQDTNPWSADIVGFNIYGDMCNIIGVGERQETQLRIRIPLASEPGSYSITDISDYSIDFYYDFERRKYTMLNGIVHIDRNLRDIDVLEGRFEFLGGNGLDTLLVNDGKFRINY